MSGRTGSTRIALAVAVALLGALPIAAAPPPLAVAWNDSSDGGGRVRSLRTTAPWPFATPPLAVGANSNLRYARGHLYAVSRSDSTVTAIATEDWTIARVYAIPGASDPLDIAVVGPDLAYVTRRFSNQLLRLDLASGATQEVLDLGGFEHPAGVVEIGMMAVDGGRLFVQVAVLAAGPAAAGEDPLPAAYLAVVDIASETLVDVDATAPRTQAIELSGTPAKYKMQIVETTRRLFVSASGAFFDDGGLEMVDLDGLRSLGLIVAEADGNVAADLGSFVLVRPNRGYLVSSTDLLPSSHLQDFTIAGGAAPTPEYHTAVDYRVPTMVHEPSTDTFFLPEGGMGGDGVHVFDAADGTRLTQSILRTSGTPTDVTLLCDDLISCAPPVPAFPPWAAAAAAWLVAGWGAFAASRRVVGSASRRRSHAAI